MLRRQSSGLGNPSPRSLLAWLVPRTAGVEGERGVRRATLDNVETITAFAGDMNTYLRESALTGPRTFIRSFVKEVAVAPGKATIRYTIPTAPDSPIGGRDAAESGLPGRVISTVSSGTPSLTVGRTFDLVVPL